MSTRRVCCSAYISPTSPLHLPYISPISPLYLQQFEDELPITVGNFKDLAKVCGPSSG